MGPLRVKNIAFDMQHTYLCLEAICEQAWPAGIEWRTVFIDHQQRKFYDILRKGGDVKPASAKYNEDQLVELMRDKASTLIKNRIVVDARAYDELPVMHGFLVNDRLLIAGVCMVEDFKIETTPYMVFLLDGEDNNLDRNISQDTIRMFSKWFDAHWSSGRAISATTQPGAVDPAKAPS